MSTDNRKGWTPALFPWPLTLLEVGLITSIAALGPALGAATILAGLYLAICLISSAGFAILTVTISQISTIGGISEIAMFAVKWAITCTVLAATIAKYTIEGRSLVLRLDLPEKLLVTLALWCCFCSLFAIHRLESLAESLRLAVYPFLVVVVRETLTTRKHVVFALLGYGLAATIGVTYSVLELNGGIGRFSGFAGNANSFGLYLSFVLPVLVAAYFAVRPSLLRLLFFSTAVLASIGLVLSWSRASMLAVLAQVVAAAVLMKKTKALVVGCSLCLIIAAAIFITPTTRNLANAALRLQGGTTHRTVIWSAGLAGTWESPLVGYGYGLQVGEIVPKVMWGDWGQSFVFKSLDNVFLPHNLYLYITLIAGLPGLAIFLTLVWSMCRRHWNAGRRTTSHALRIANYTIVAMIIGALANGFFEAAALIGKGAINNYFWVAVGIVAALEKIESEEQEGSTVTRS